MSADSRLLLWRLHGLAALLALPFLLIATITGLIYLPTPQIEAWQMRGLSTVAPGPWLPMDGLVAKAQAAAPAGYQLRHVSPPVEPGQSLRLQFAPPKAMAGKGHEGHQPAGADAEPVDLYIDPGTGAVLGELRESALYSSWAKRLHSRLLLGEGLRWMIEWAATCLLGMLLTGLLLAWPRAGESLAPGAAPVGRLRWRAWHRLIGALLGGMSLVIVLTGLTWSQTAGSQVRAARDWAQQGAPRVPADLRSALRDGADRLSWAAATARAAELAPGVRLQIAPPAQADGVWRVQSIDRRLPGRRADIAFDAYDGELLWRSSWADLPAFAKATAVGIPFHRGEFGLWNQLLLLAFGLGLLASGVSGVAMAWMRWRRGQALLPAVRNWTGLGWRWPLLAAALLLCGLIPLLAACLLIYLLVEWCGARRLAA
jgi:uncharacterized iron-regulated membrane protein